MAESIYKTAAAKRANNQNEIKQALDGKKKLSRINISIPEEYKDKLNAYCEENYISASALIRSWIDEHCN